MSLRPSSIFGTIVLVVLFGAWFGLFRPVSLGGPATWVVIRGSSMQPTYDTGDLVVMHASDAYASGDVVAYRVPEGQIGEGHVVVHRLAGGNNGAWDVLGDNNDSLDPWHPSNARHPGQTMDHGPRGWTGGGVAPSAGGPGGSGIGDRRFAARGIGDTARCSGSPPLHHHLRLVEGV